MDIVGEECGRGGFLAPAPAHEEDFLLPFSCSNTTVTNYLLAMIHYPLLLNNRTPVLLQMAMSPAKRQHF